MSLFNDRPFRATAAGHFAVDLINSQRALILATWSTPFGLSNSLIGILSTVYTLLGSTLQPVFGLLADRIGARWVATLGILWMALSFGMAVLVPGRVALLMLVLTAIGSAAFHPAGTAEATQRARQQLHRQSCIRNLPILPVLARWDWRLGPALGGVIVELQGVSGLIVLLIVVVPVGIYAGLSIPSGGRHSATVQDALSSVGRLAGVWSIRNRDRLAIMVGHDDDRLYSKVIQRSWLPSGRVRDFRRDVYGWFGDRRCCWRLAHGSNQQASARRPYVDSGRNPPFANGGIWV